MATEAPARPSGRPRTALLVLLAIVAGVFVVSRMWPTKSAAPVAAPSNQAREPAARTQSGPVDPADLLVRTDDLKKLQPPADEGQRNPFKFYTPPPPPLPPPPPVDPTRQPVNPAPPPQPTGPPPPPPIPLKFIGILEVKPGDKIAAFSDCRYTYRGREGEIISGQYRLLKIGVESVVMEYVDKRGQTTIKLTGQDCLGK
jgi:hypothetical protein